MNADNLLAWHCEHVVGIVVAQILLGGEGEFGQVGQRLEVIGMHPGSLEPGAVMRHVLVNVVQRPFQALGLQCGNLVAAGIFDGV